MATYGASLLVGRIEQLVSKSPSDWEAENLLESYLKHFRSSCNMSDGEWRGVLLCASDILDPDHPRYNLLAAGLLKEMSECAERRRTGT